MEAILETRSIIRRARWLIQWRFGFVFLLAAATFSAQVIFHIGLFSACLYGIACCVFLYNILLWLLLCYLTRKRHELSYKHINRILNLQISADLLILTAVLYFSGGIANPFFFYYIFHMIVASMLLSSRMSYLQATLAVVLFAGMIGLQYSGILRYYELKGFMQENLYQDLKYILAVLIVLTTTLYGAVYLTTSIIQQLRKQQDRLESANEQLQEKDQVKNKYVLRVSHDIKSHLAAIKGCLDILSAHLVGPLNPEQTDLVERADRRTSKCIQFLSALLKLTQMRLTGQMEKEGFSLKNAVFNAFSSAEELALAKAIGMTYELDPAVDELYGSRVLIEDTITNLLANAVKYTPSGGRVHLEVQTQADWILVKIQDTGIGIPPEEIDRIFEEFYRASNARKVERDGTGLGLSMAREVIERHGGKISVMSDSAGSTFTVTLPKTR